MEPHTVKAIELEENDEVRKEERGTRNEERGTRKEESGGLSKVQKGVFPTGGLFAHRRSEEDGLITSGKADRFATIREIVEFSAPRVRRTVIR